LSWAALSMGANMGNRMVNLRTALRLLKLNGVKILARSDIFETAPFGVTHQPRFLNACITIETDLDPYSLLDLLKRIEKDTGRILRKRWGPREIDIDILLMENTLIRDPKLQIPHPGLHERAFVLKPLCQIAPDMIHPLKGKSISALWEDIPQEDRSMVRIGNL